ncbi:hypothetical protein AB0K12_48115 [Nonomuraea sp. NPDC049419]|uniref:hypothetical protein n=1 Tax=Nonomuraea sp. NPDC049419 TaxID=3155772 RepID=UPI003416957F
MPTKEQALRLLSQGHDDTEIAAALGIPAGQAYLIATGVAADGGDGGGTVTRAQRQRPGMSPSREPASTVEARHALLAREKNPQGR